MSFVKIYLSDLFRDILTLQKESGGILDFLGMFNGYKKHWQALCRGDFDPKLKRAMEKLPSAKARSASAMFQLCGQTLSEKVDSILTKTVKANAIKAASCILSMCPSTLQTPNMVATDVIKSVVPLIDPLEWERYITLPAQTPPPTTPSLFQLGRYCYVCHTPSASQIELKILLIHMNPRFGTCFIRDLEHVSWVKKAIDNCGAVGMVEKQGKRLS